MVSLLIKKKFSSQLTPSAVKKYYETHKENFATDLAHVQHILVSDENEAKKIFKMAQNPQNDFQELAENYSKDPTAKNNRGDLGLVGHGRLAPEFLNAVFATAPGAVTGPIHTTFGYHVIKVVSKKVGRPMEFEEVKLQVQTALEQELMRQYITSLKGQTKVQVNRAAVEKN
jgi:parvulin-like peptidyl-prolyl isomerase